MYRGDIADFTLFLKYLQYNLIPHFLRKWRGNKMKEKKLADLSL